MTSMLDLHAVFLHQNALHKAAYFVFICVLYLYFGALSHTFCVSKTPQTFYQSFVKLTTMCSYHEHGLALMCVQLSEW